MSGSGEKSGAEDLRGGLAPNNVVPIRAASRPAVEEDSDAELVERCLTGDKAAEKTLYLRHVRMATGLAHRLAPEADALDIVQDAFLAAFSGLKKLREPQFFRSWLGAIVVRRARKVLRRKKMLRRLGIASADPVDCDRMVSGSAPPDVSAELQGIYRLLNELPVDSRVALVLRRVEGLEIREVAERMQVSPTTAKRRIKEGETLLRQRLGRTEIGEAV